MSKWGQGIKTARQGSVHEGPWALAKERDFLLETKGGHQRAAVRGL